MEKKKFKGLFFTVGCVFLAFIILFLSLFIVEYVQSTVWHTGTVLIGDNIVTLPCSLNEFERQLNPEIIFDSENQSVRNVKVGSLKFTIEVEDGMVKAIILGAKKDDATDTDGNDRDVADDVVFPGSITINSDISDVKKVYGTTPLNVFKGDCFVNLPAGEEHKCTRYANREWKIEVYTIDSRITSISYYYLGK